MSDSKTPPEYDFSVGYSDDGELTISDGGLVRDYNGNIGRNSNGTGTVTVTGAGSTWNNDRNVYVGFFGTGDLLIEQGGVVNSAAGIISYRSGSTGTVTVTGAGSTWAMTGDLAVADFGGTDGTLNIDNGGKISGLSGRIGVNDGSSGSVTVTGTGSSWTNNRTLHIGQGGAGELTISDNGTVSNSIGYIGDESTSTGKVTVTGQGSTWTNTDNLYVANYGDGKLDISNGGSVTSLNGFIGYSPGGSGEVTVDGANSTWTNTGDLYVGHWGDGKLDISAGGTVTNSNGSIGGDYSGTARGEVTVDGVGSTWTNTGNLYVGHWDYGALDISAGGTVSSTDGYIGYEQDSTGAVTVDGAGSTWTNNGNLEVGVAGNGTLDIINGGSVTNFDGSIGVVSGILGKVTVDNSTWTNNGALNVGLDGDGQLSVINGSLAIATGGTLIADGVGSGSLEVATGGTLETLGLEAGNGTPSATFDDGTLRAIADNAGFISNFSLGDLVIDAGGLTIDSDVFDIATDSSAFTGSGGMTKIGTGTLTLGGNNDYSGDTLVAFGTLKAGDLDVFSPNSTFTINTGATMNLDGHDQTVAGLINSGTVSMGSGASVKPVGTILTVNGNYESNGGSLYIRTTLGDDSSVTDKLVAESVTTGSGGATSMYVANVNGFGDYTYADGIQVVQVKTTSSTDAFRLGAPVTAGIYEYKLERASNESWYLTNTQTIVGPFDPPTDPPTDPSTDPPTDPSGGGRKLLNPNIGSYLGNQHAAATMFRHSIFDRLENLSSPDQTIWLRVNYSDLKTDLLDGRQHADITTTIAQIGIDLIRRDQWVAGVYGGYGHSKTENKSNQTGTKADGKVDGGHVGLYWSWLPEENHGFYTDLWTYYAWFNNKLTGEAQSHTTKYDSTGYAFSGEIGYQIPISQREDGGAWLLTPQAQLSYVNVDADNFTDSHGTRFTNNEGSGYQSRLGARLHGQRGPCYDGVLPFIELNWLHNAADNDIRLNGTNIGSVIGRNVGEVKVGLQGTIIEGLSVWGHVGARQGNDGYERYDAQLGLAKRW